MMLSNPEDGSRAGRGPELRETNARLVELVQRLSHLRDIEARVLSESLGERLGRELGELHGDLNRLTQPGSVSPRQAALLRRVLTRLERAQDQLRRLRYELAPPGVAELGLAPTVARRTGEFAARTGIAVECSIGELPEQLPVRAAALLERVLDEGLRNVERHAGARCVQVAASTSGSQVVLRISDDGAGLVDADRRRPHRLGLLALEVCLAEIGGTLQVTSGPARGTTLVAAVPMRMPRRGRPVRAVPRAEAATTTTAAPRRRGR
jgi:signal transduction histidine kinase